MTVEARLVRGLQELALDLPDDALRRLLGYLDLLVKWNRTYNLTAVRDPLEMVSHHLLDSLAVLAHLPMGGGEARLADVGSGAGLPGLPIAIARPDWQVCLNDSNEKKVAFLRQASIELDLPNVTIHAGRAEQWRPAQTFGCVITRAFASLRDFVSLCRHLIAAGGVLAAMKGVHPGAEIDALGGVCDCGDVRRIHVPLLDAERHLVLCRLPAAGA